MSTDLKTTSAAGGALAALGNLKQGLQNVQSGIRVAGGEPILRMGRDGVWIYGADNVEVEPGSEWAINPMSLEHGFICWKVIPEGSKEKPELLGQEIRSMFEPLPNKDSLPDYGHPWAELLSVQLKCVSGEDAGEQVLYKTSSTGGMRVMKETIGLIMAAIDDHPETPVPVVLLKADHYPHKQYGKTYFPVIEVARWATMDGVAAAPAAEPAKEQAKAPAAEQAKPSRRAAPAAAAPVQEAAADEEEDIPAEQAAPFDGGVRRRRRAA